MSYASAGVVTPANNTDNSYTWFGPLIGHIFTTFNATDAIVSGAVGTATANKLVMRGANAEATFGILGVAPLAASASTALNVNAPTGHTGNLLQLLLNSSNIFAVAPSGIVTVQGASASVNAPAFGGTGVATLATGGTLVKRGTNGDIITGTISAKPQVDAQLFYGSLFAGQTAAAFLVQNATGSANLWFIGPDGAGWHASTVTAVGGFIGNASSATELATFAVTATGTNNTITVAAGSFITSAGVQANVVQTAINLSSFAAQSWIPTTGNQWVALSLDVNGGYVITPGTVGGAQTTAVVPAGNWPVRYIFLRQNTTAIYNTDQTTAATGYLAPRATGSAFGSGGGGASTPAADSLQFYIQPDILKRLVITGSNDHVTLQAGATATGNFPATPFTMAVQGKQFKYTTNTQTTNTARAALGNVSGTVLVVADVNAGTIFFAANNATLATYQIVIARYYWIDTPTFALVAMIDPTPVQSIVSGGVVPQINSVPTSGNPIATHLAFASVGAFARDDDTHMVLNAFNIPAPMTVRIRSFVHMKSHLAASTDSVIGVIYVNGSSYACCGMGRSYITATGISGTQVTEDYFERTAWISLPAAGYYQVGQYWITTAGATVDLFEREVSVEFYAALQAV